jgi:hypothetical protein
MDWRMIRFAHGFTHGLDPETAALELAEAACEGLAGGVASGAPGDAALGSDAFTPVGGLLLQTAAAGDLGHRIAERLARRWPAAHWVGASFEGILAGGRTLRDEPAVGLLVWTAGAGEPLPFSVSPDARSGADLAAEIAAESGRDAFEAGDLILLFPDTAAAPRLEAALAELGPRLQPATLVGSAASATDGPAVWLRFGAGPDETESGALVGLVVPAVGAAGARVRAAEASRPASPWLAVTRCRERWVDGLDEEPALVWVRRQLGLDEDAPIEPHLERLLVRIAPPLEAAPSVAHAPLAEPEAWDERYVVGLDEGRGAFALPRSLRLGEQIALALPDADRGREALREAIGALPRTPLLLQLACRARDASLHGDPDLESAWVAHHAPDRLVLGTVAPFQLATGEDGIPRLLVHSTVLAALGPEAGLI